MSRNQKIIAAVAALLIAVGAGAYYLLRETSPASSPSAQTASVPASGAPTGPLPAPVVLIISKAAVVQLSKAGQDIQRQAQGYAQQARGELQGQISSLQNDAASLKAQQASLSPEVRQQRLAAFEAKQAALQQVVAKHDTQIKAGLTAAQKKMEAALGPILKKIMAERKANMIVDRQAVIFATDSGFDISRDAIAQLDAVLPAIKVDLPPLQ